MSEIVCSTSILDQVKLRRGVASGNFWFCPCRERNPQCDSDASTYCRSGFGFSRSQLCHCGHSLRPDIFDLEMTKLSSRRNIGTVYAHPMDPLIDINVAPSSATSLHKIPVLSFSAVVAKLEIMKSTMESESNKLLLFDTQLPSDPRMLYPDSLEVDRPATDVECGIDFASIIEREATIVVPTSTSIPMASSSQEERSSTVVSRPVSSVSTSQTAVSPTQITAQTQISDAIMQRDAQRATVTTTTIVASPPIAEPVAALSAQDSNVNHNLTTVDGRASYINQVLAPNPLSLTAVNNMFSLNDHQWELIRKLFDLKDTQNVMKRDLIEQVLELFSHDVANRLE
jgi:hypothetical protein